MKPNIPQIRHAAQHIPDALLGSRFQERGDNRFEFLVDAVQFYPAMLVAISNARHYILFEQYIISSGHVADRFIKALAEAVERGVKVYVQLDHFGIRHLAESDRERMQQCGIRLAFYNPAYFPHIRRGLPRNHRKLIIVDGQVCFTGGYCISDEYDPAPASEDSAWHDVVVRIEGSVIADWQTLFIENWQNLTGQLPELPDIPAPPAVGTQTGLVTTSRPRRPKGVKRMFIRHVRHSRKRAWIATAYFVPSRKILRMLCRAVSRGVDVRLLLPGSINDHPAVRFAGRRFYRYLLRHGVRIFEFQPRFMHAKVYLCDDWASVGSCNMDRWNLHWNLEANQEVHDTEFATSVAALFEANFGYSHEITLPEWLRRPWHERLRRMAVGLCRPVARALQHPAPQQVNAKQGLLGYSFNHQNCGEESKTVHQNLKLLILPFFAISMALSPAVYAGSLEDGIAAFERHDDAAAVIAFRAAAEQGNPTAQFNLGFMYFEGLGVEKNYQEAINWYRKAAEAGNADAQLNLGIIYDKGQGAERNDQEAAGWYIKAAEQGIAAAQNNLGIMYAEGQGVEQNDEKAVAWYIKAAEQRYALAQFNLANAYYMGKETDQNYSKAYVWFDLAAANGESMAVKNRNLAAEKMTPARMTEAQFNLGFRYNHGHGVNKHLQKAVDWYRKAAEQGDTRAQTNLGFMYTKGQGVAQDYKAAVNWYRKAAKQGYALAQFNLGTMYAKGQGVVQDFVQSYMWLDLAATSGHAAATRNRDRVASRLSSPQISAAKRMASELKSKN